MKRAFVALTLFAAAAPAALAAEIAVAFSPEFTEKMTEDYGLREGERLAGYVTRDITRELTRAGVDLARVEVTILDAKPSRPTFKQGSDTPGLDIFRSVSLGGMELTATGFDAAGKPVGELSYDWFETDIRFAGLTTWHDASRASARFARRFAERLN